MSEEEEDVTMLEVTQSQALEDLLKSFGFDTDNIAMMETHLRGDKGMALTIHHYPQHKHLTAEQEFALVSLMSDLGLPLTNAEGGD